MNNPKEVRFKLRRDIAVDWTTNNPVLREGEPGLQTQKLVTPRVLPVGNYMVTVDMPNGNYWRTTNFFTSAVTRGRVQAPINAGGFSIPAGSTPATFGSTSYGVSMRWEEYYETDWSIIGRY